MSWKDELIEIVSDCAPILGSALAGPTGGMVGHIIAQAFGKEKADLVQEIKSDPDAQDKLKQIQADHEADLLKLSVQKSAIEALRAIVEMD